MVNGKALVEEVKNIEKFFQEMSIREFKEMMVECSEEHYNVNYESNYVLYRKSLPVTGQKYANNIIANYGDEFNNDCAQKYYGQDNLGAA